MLQAVYRGRDGLVEIKNCFLNQRPDRLQMQVDGMTQADVSRVTGVMRPWIRRTGKALGYQPDIYLYRYTDQELKTLWEMRSQGQTFREIAQVFGINDYKKGLKKLLKRAEAKYGALPVFDTAALSKRTPP